MSKILKNNTGSPVIISDVGQTVPAASQLLIQVTDYLLYAASSDVIILIGDSTLTVNDGSTDLSISDGTDLIKGLFPTQIAVTQIDDPWRVNDADAISILNSIAISLGASTASVFKFAELAVTSRNEVDLTGTSYTVPSGKQFFITSFSASYDAQAQMYVRVKKQTGGAGSFVTQFRMVMMSGGQGESTKSFDFGGGGIFIGSPTDVFKITIESSISKGTIWAQFAGSEI